MLTNLARVIDSVLNACFNARVNDYAALKTLEPEVQFGVEAVRVFPNAFGSKRKWDLA